MAPKPSASVPDKSASSRQAAAINDAQEGGITKGSKVWLRGNSGTAWEAAEIKSLDTAAATAQVLLETNGKLVVVDVARLLPANPRLQEGIPDLTHLSHLNEPGILYNLRHRYASDGIYTFAGPVLIALNPCKPLPLYTTEVANTYKAGARDVVASGSMPPHIYLVAANAFRRMIREKTSQSLIVNGESGAGKTETTKKAMQYFATLAGGTGVEDQVLETNPILEAFGNAKTLRNHNSSRFGKLIQIHFNQSHHICGAAVKTYLLEKSRVVHQLPGERSYHIFYQLVRGASKEARAAMRLPDHPTGFKFLAASGCTDIQGVDDAADFRSVCSALKDVGIGAEQQEALFRLLAGVLWLGNLSFQADELDMGNDATLLVEDAACSACCHLLGMTAAALGAALTRKRIITPSEVITKLLNMEESKDCRDALAKSLYSSTFDWIVSRINIKLDTGKKGSGLFIAILDIYGFEQFTRNSFEQLCINYANERLQQQFTRHLFTLEQQEYEAEGIDWTKVEFIDNQECVDAIEAMPPKGLGVLAVLDSQCRFPKATDETFVTTLKDQLGAHTHFGVTARAPREFTILHYAGPVSYDSLGFLDKNKDTLNTDLVDLMVGADPEGTSLVPSLGAAVREEGEANVRRGGQTVGSRFAQQLRDLIAELDTTGLHFVRCIKPNVALQPNTWEEGMALHQLRCCGVLEVARIARAGFPTRYMHQAFAERYAILLPREQQTALLAAAARQVAGGALTGGQEEHTSALAACQHLVEVFGLNASQFQVGRTKLFFRPGVLGFVEDKWAAMQTAALDIQAFWRMYRARAAYRRMQTAATCVQTVWRGRCQSRAFVILLQQTRAARVIQRGWRLYAARSHFLRVCATVRTIQMAWKRSRLAKRVKRRVFDREKRELVARLEQDKFENVKSEYGCDMVEVRAALAAWRAVKESAADPSGTGQSLVDDAAAAQALMAQAQGHALPGGTARALVAEAAAATSAVAVADMVAAAEASPAEAIPTQTSDFLVGDAEGERDSQTRISGSGFSPAAVAAARFAATQASKEDRERLVLENMRLTKQLQLERSLKERYQHKYEEQNGLWLEQIRVLQEYIQQVRIAFGDARLPPLPSALIASGTAPIAGPRISGDAPPLPARLSAQAMSPFASAGGALAPAPTPVPATSPFAAAMAAAAMAVADEPPLTQLVPLASAAAAPPSGSVPAKSGPSRDAASYMMHGGESDEEEAAKANTKARGATGNSGQQEEDEEEELSPAASATSSIMLAFAATSAAAAAVVSAGITLRPGAASNSGMTGPSTVSMASPSHAQGDRGEAGLLPSTSQAAQHPAAATRSPSPPQAHRALAPHLVPEANRNSPASLYVAQLTGEFGNVQKVLDDDVGFITEVAGGQIAAQGMDPGAELAMLKKKFELWRKEYRDKLQTAEEVLMKLDRLERARPGSGGVRAHLQSNGSGSHGNGQRQAAPRPEKKSLMGKLFG